MSRLSLLVFAILIAALSLITASALDMPNMPSEDDIRSEVERIMPRSPAADGTTSPSDGGSIAEPDREDTGSLIGIIIATVAIVVIVTVIVALIPKRAK